MVEPKDRRTYTTGYNLVFEEDVTKGSMVSLCLELNKEFKAEGHTFEPEGVSDGFVHVSNYGLVGVDGYKSIRVHPRDNCFFCKQTGIGWPSVPPDVMSVWSGDDTVIYSKHTETSEETLKWRRKFPLSPARGVHDKCQKESFMRRLVRYERRDSDRAKRLGEGRKSTNRRFKDQGHGTTLKAFYDAAPWTQTELARCGGVFERYGIFHMDVHGRRRKGENVIPP